MYDKEFAETFKEEVELDEMNWAVGGVYHQEFKNGDKVYFRADSVQKNKRWKGLSVDEFGGRQKKAKNASADEKQQGWEITPKNEIPKGLKEEVEIDERKSKKDYELYHKTYSDAVQHAADVAKKQGYEVDQDSWDSEISFGQRKPSKGKTVSKKVELTKGGKSQKKKLHIQVYGMDSGKYELNMYIESKEVDTTDCPLEIRRKKYVELNKKDPLNPLNKIKEALTRIRSLVEKPEGIADRGTGYTTHVKKFPPELLAGLKKIIPGGKFEPEDEMRRHGKVLPGLSITLPGWNVSKLLIQHLEKTEMPKKGTTVGKIATTGSGKDWSGKDEPKGGVNAEVYRAHEMNVWIDKAAELKDFGDEGKSDWYPLKEFDGVNSTEATKKVIQFLKTKVKRMAKEEVEIDEARKSANDIGMECQECGKKFRTKLKSLKYGVTKCPRCKSTDLDFAYGSGVLIRKEDVEEARSKEDELELAKAIAAWKKAGGKVKKLPPGRSFKSLFKGKPLPRQEEVDIEEEAKPKQMSSDEKLKMWNKLKSGKTIELWYDSSIAKGSAWREFKVGRKTASKKYNLEKVSLQHVDRPGGVKHYLYNRQGKISMAIGDMGASLISMKEEVETEARFRSPRDHEDLGIGNVKYFKKKGDRKAKRKKDYEEVDMDEGTALQVKMALDDVRLKGTWKNGKVYVKKRDVKKAEKALKGNVIYKGKPPVVVGENILDRWKEAIDLKRSDMGAVIKDFQDSDAPQFKGKSDKKRREMAIAAKLSADRNEEVDEKIDMKKAGYAGSRHKDIERDKYNKKRKGQGIKDEVDNEQDNDSKSKKKDKINLKPKMDETMKNYKEFMKKVKEKQITTQEATGDEAEYQKKRKAVAAKFGVGSCSALKDEKEKKACYKALDDAHVADHEESVKVQEGVTEGGIEYGEQDWDVQHRLDNIVSPPLGTTYKEVMDEDLEGPYLWQGGAYFFDRKVGSWYSVTSEDYVDDEMNKELSLNYTKDGLYKKQFGS